MKIQYWLTHISIVIVVVGIGIVVLVKYIIPKSNRPVAITNIQKINLSDLNGTEIPLEKMVEDNGPTYFMIFDLVDCYTCIFRGLEDLEKIKSAGHNCIAIMIHDRVDEASGWATTQRYTPFYMLKKADFYNYIRTPMTPVMIKLVKGKVDSYYYIRP